MGWWSLSEIRKNDIPYLHEQSDDKMPREGQLTVNCQGVYYGEGPFTGLGNNKAPNAAGTLGAEERQGPR